jgi:ABC-2 type transport system permease protein
MGPETRWAVVGGAALLATAGAAVYYGLRVLANGLLEKELRHYFASPIAWLVMAGFSFVNGYVFLFIVDYFSGFAAPNQPLLQLMFGNGFFWILQFILVPAITMRLIAEERATGTLETLMTAPVTDAEVVMAKYFAALKFYAALWLPTLVHVAVAYWYGAPEGFGKAVSEGAEKLAAAGTPAWRLPYVVSFLRELNAIIDFGPVLCAYLGVLLMGSAWIGIGILTSSFTKNQVVAFVLAFVAAIMTFSMGFATQLLPSSPQWQWLSAALKFASFQNAYDPFPRGILDTRSVVYFLSITVASLFLSVRIVESRRWR